MQQLDLWQDFYWRKRTTIYQTSANTDQDWMEHLKTKGHKVISYNAFGGVSLSGMFMNEGYGLTINDIVGVQPLAGFAEIYVDDLISGFNAVQNQGFQPNTMIMHPQVWADLVNATVSGTILTGSGINIPNDYTMW